LDWEWYSVLCPDFTKNAAGTFLLRGDISHMVSKSFTFTVNRCDPKKTVCASKEDIDDFIKDIQVDSWSKNEELDFNEFIKRPTFKVQALLGSYLLNNHTIQNEMLSLREHGIYMEDDRFIP
jgi:predicted AlkP superfamily phosphohydrolase/phosphomutase